MEKIENKYLVRTLADEILMAVCQTEDEAREKKKIYENLYVKKCYIELKEVKSNFII